MPCLELSIPQAALSRSGLGGSVQPSLKRLIAVDSSNFQINQRAPNGKTLCLRIVRNQGSDDAGSAHEPWRLGHVYILDAVTDSYAVGTGGWGTVAVSNGAKDYARKRGNPVGSFGGSVHGGETVVSEVITADGKVIDGLSDIEARVFAFVRTTTITWPDGSTATVAFTMTIGEDMVVSMSMRHTSDALMGNPAAPYQDYYTLDLADPRFTRLLSEAGTIDMPNVEAEYDLLASQRLASLVDPATGDEIRMDLAFDTDLSRFHCWYVPDQYAKLYASSPGGVLPPAQVSKRVEYRLAAIAPKPATLPHVETFSGSALGPLWKRVAGAGAVDGVAGGEFVLGYDGSGTAAGYVMPIHREPGSYRVEIAYRTDTAQTSAQIFVTRADTFNPTNPMVAAQNLNSPTGTTLAVDFDIVAGQTPWLRIAGPGFAGRTARIRSITISRLS